MQATHRCHKNLMSELPLHPLDPPLHMHRDGGSSGAGGSAPWHTASTAFAPTSSGSHVFKVQGYSRIKGFGLGNCITSSPFAVGGHRWCIDFYPDGYQNLFYIAFFLRRLDRTDANEVKAQFFLRLLDPTSNGNPSGQFMERQLVETFRGKDQFGSDTFISRNKLEQSAYLKDDVLRVRCDITVIKDVVTQDFPPIVVVPPSDMHRHLGWLLSAGEGADVTFEVGGERIAAHNCILAARSSVFKAELLGPMKEKTAACVRIDDMDAKAFRAMLHFIYTPETDESEAAAMAQHLLVAADMYNLERLKLICEEKLCGHIGTSTAATTLALAEQHRCRRLKEACFNFLTFPGNMKAVMVSDGFEHLKTSCPSILEELITNFAP